MPPVLLTIWILGIAAKSLAALRILSKGLFQRLPIFWAFILISVARSTALLCFWGDQRRYGEIAADSAPMMLLSEAFAIASVFWLVTENFPQWRKPGTVSLATLAIIGTAAAYVVRSAGVPPDWGYGWARAWEWALVLQRNAMVAMAVVLAGVRFLLALVRMVPVRPIARRAADVLCIDVLLGLCGSALTIWVGRRIPLVAYLWPVLAGLANGLLWAFWLPAASEGRDVERATIREPEQAIDWRGCVVDLIGRIRLQLTR